MTYDPSDPTRAFEYPSMDKTPRPADPYAPVDYPSYPPPSPPPSPVPYPPPYQGYGPDPYSSSAGAATRGTNGMAVASLVTSLVGTLCCGVGSVVGLVLGIVAMRETKRTGQEGYGLALAGTIIGGIAVAIGIVGFVIWIVLVAAAGTSTTYRY